MQGADIIVAEANFLNGLLQLRLAMTGMTSSRGPQSRSDPEFGFRVLSTAFKMMLIGSNEKAGLPRLFCC
jgi:hypothetical protein